MTRPADDTTKPSRLNRRRKKRWKIAKITDLIEAGLTDCARVAMLFTVGNKPTRPINPEKQGVKTPIQGVFYCPKKISTPLVRAIVMVARSGLLKSGPEPCLGVDNPLRVAAQNLSTFGGGLYLRQGATA